MANFFLEIKSALEKIIKNSKLIIAVGFLSVIVGVVFGFVCFNTNINFFGILSSTDHQILKYVSGSVNCFELFFDKLLSLVVLAVIIFVFSLTIHTIFLNLIFIAYQSMVFVISILSIIKVFGFAGILDVILIILPINIMWLAFVLLLFLITEERAKEGHKFKEPLLSSFKGTDYLKLIILDLILGILVCFVYAFVCPLILKSFALILY